MSKQTEPGSAFAPPAGYASRLMISALMGMTLDYNRDRLCERQPLTAALKRQMRGYKPNRTRKPGNSAKVNAKRTKQAAERAKHNNLAEGRPHE